MTSAPRRPRPVPLTRSRSSEWTLSLDRRGPPGSPSIVEPGVSRALCRSCLFPASTTDAGRLAYRCCHPEDVEWSRGRAAAVCALPADRDAGPPRRNSLDNLHSATARRGPPGALLPSRPEPLPPGRAGRGPALSVRDKNEKSNVRHLHSPFTSTTSGWTHPAVIAAVAGTFPSRHVPDQARPELAVFWRDRGGAWRSPPPFCDSRAES